MRIYQKRLKEKGIIQSMSRKGNCLDNSVMDYFEGYITEDEVYQEFYDESIEAYPGIFY